MSDRAEARGAARPESRPEQELVLIANARVPSQRAQTLQVVQMAGAFSRAGVRTTLLHASRRDTPELPAGSSVFDWYRLGEGARPEVRALPCEHAHVGGPLAAVGVLRAQPLHDE